MPTEDRFVGLEQPHVVSGKKHLLYCEMEILTALQKYNEYKKFRKEELALKNLLKKVITEMKKEMEVLMEHIPKIKTEVTVVEQSKPKTQIAPAKRDLLEEEIQKIRSKIALLSGNQN